MCQAITTCFWNENLTIPTLVSFSPQIPNFLISQVRRLNENSNRRYQFYDRRIKNLLKKIHTDSREKPGKNALEVSWFTNLPQLCVVLIRSSKPQTRK